MMTILVALAELERSNISQATKDRLQALKNLGKKLGRPQGSQDKKPRRKSGYFLRHGRKA
jgi:DNA invertase Pin-like site-specific DNA recombinase